MNNNLTKDICASLEKIQEELTDIGLKIAKIAIKNDCGELFFSISDFNMAISSIETMKYTLELLGEKG